MSVSSYYLIQAFSSSLFLVSLSLIYDNLMINFIGLLLYNFTLSIKIGLFPFHSWVLNLVSSINWLSIGLLSTLQKFIPIMILSIIIWYYYYLVVGLFTIVIRIYYSLGLTRIKVIFSYSILSHRSWITLVILNLNWWLIYYFIYRIIFMIICIFNYYISLNELTDFSCIFSSRFILLIYLLNLISLRGIPPFTGFLLKWLLLDLFSETLSYLFLFILVLTSIVHLYIYICIFISGVFIFNGISKLMVFNFHLNYLLPFFLFSFSLLVNLFIMYLGLLFI